MNDVSRRRAPLLQRSAVSTSSASSASSASSPEGHQTKTLERVQQLSAENAVVVFSTSSCCMCHVVKRLLCGLGVNPLVYELDEEKDGSEVEKALARFMGTPLVSPTVFVGGKLVGGLDQVMASHIGGTLVPRLKEAGALWL